MRFEALRESLLRGGIAPRHARRYLAELEDHLADLTARERDAGHDGEDAAIRARAALGDDAMLASAMLAKPRLRSLSARAPWLVFGLLPPLAALLTSVIPVAALVVIGKTHGLMLQHAIPAPVWFRHLAAGVTLTSNLIQPVLLAALLVLIAARQRLPFLWPLIGSALIALMGVHMHVDFPSHGRGSIMLTSLVLAGPHRLPVLLLSDWPLLLAQSILTLSPLIGLGLVKWRRAA